LVEQGYRCPVCGGEVALAPREPAVAVAAESQRSPRQDDSSERRFDRD
jgi:hypothetical protein